MQTLEVITQLRAETGAFFNEEFFVYCFKDAFKQCIAECRNPTELIERVYHNASNEFEFIHVLHAEEGLSQEEVQQKTEAMLLMISTAVHVAVDIERGLMSQFEVSKNSEEIFS